MKPSLVALFLMSSMLFGCAMPPSKSDLAGIPVVNFGEPLPESGDYVLYFPAGKPIPSTVTIDGDIFQQTAQKKISVQLERGIYSYRDWASYDGKNWLDGRDMLGIKLEISLPGYKHPKPGEIHISINKAP